MVKDEVVARAIRAAHRAAKQTGVTPGEPIVLYRSRRVILRFPAIRSVARVGPTDAKSLAGTTRELDVARHLAQRGAPVVGPSKFMGSKPFVDEGVAVTLWPYIEHRPWVEGDRDAAAQAARALRQVHEILADYSGELPSYAERIEECGELLRRRGALPALADEDVAFLLHTFERLIQSLATFDIPLSPIHGDAYLGNVFFTPEGPLWTDFEAACLGPYEWDFVGVPYAGRFSAADLELCAVLADLRSLCVVVWCSALSERPEKRAAAAFQLARLKGDADASADDGRLASRS